MERRKKMDKVKFFTFEKYHGKRDIGSTRIRVHNLIKYWDEAELYQYGDKADVLIFQKVYANIDYKLPLTYPAIKILDICDPDFKDSPDIFIKETLDAMDAVTVPTESFKTFLEQMTDTPIYVVKDRFDLEEFPKPKVHTGKAKTIVWFGYSHNSMGIKLAMPSIERRKLKLHVVSDSDFMPYKMCIDSKGYQKDMYSFTKYTHPEAYKEIQKGDICVLPPTNRPFDIFKSENKRVISELLGVPVATNAEELDKLIEAEDRQKHINAIYDKIREDYDCRQSVKEYKDIIENIIENREISRNE